MLGTFLWIGTSLGALFVITFFAIQIPYIQTKIVNSLTKYLSTRTEHTILIGSVNISWFDSMVFNDFKIADTVDSTMLETKSVLIDFSLLDIISGDDIQLDAVRLEGSTLFLQKVNDSTALNITYFLRKLRSRKTGNEESPIVTFRVGKIKIENATFAVNDFRKSPASTQWDYNHILYRNVNCSMSDLLISGDTVNLKIDQLTALDDKGKLNIRSMSSLFQFTNQYLRFDELNLKTDFSYLSNSVEFSYSEPASLSYFVDSVGMSLNFDKAVIHPNDLQLFSSSKIPFRESIQLNATLDGKVGRFELKELQLRLGKSSQLSGYVSMNGLPDIKETFMDIKLNNSTLLSDDLKSFTPLEIHPYLDSLKSIHAKASFLGFYSDFVANGSFATELGNISSNLNLKLPHEGFIGCYSGKLSLDDFKLGRFIKEAGIDAVSMEGSINGNGFDRHNANFFLNATLDKIGYNNYQYTNIQTDAEFVAQFFEGKLEINDPNLKFNVNGTVDLRNGLNKVNINGDLDTLNLRALNISNRDIFLSTQVDLDFNGLDLDSIIGFADLNSFYLRYENRDILIDTISIISVRNFDNRDLTIKTELARLNASGNFNYSTLYNDTGKIWKEYRLIFNNNPDSIQHYFASADHNNTNQYKIDLSLTVADADPYLTLFTDNISVGKDTQIKGAFSHGETTILQLTSHLDTLIINDNEFYNNQFDLNTSKLSNSTAILAMMFLSSERQVLKQSASFDNLYWEAIWQGTKIEFSSNIQQTDAENKVRLYGDFIFLTDKYRLSFKPSELIAIGHQWDFSSDNEIIFDNGDIIFNDFKLNHEDQVIQLSGISSQDSEKILSLSVNNFKLDNLNPIINSKLNGILNAEADIIGRGEDFLVQSNLKISELELNKFLVGDVIGTSNWENADERLRLGFEVDRLGRKVIQLGGYFYPKEEQQLDIVANFDETSLKVAEPFISKNFSSVDGSLTGQLTIGGPLGHPVLKGTGLVDNGKVTVNYLNTDYSFNGNVIFGENEIGVRNLNITDENNNLSTANGDIFHDGFSSFILDISAKLKNFQVLNTSATDNELYYGTAHLTGNVNFSGTLSNLQISAKATTNRGTRIFIPLSNTSDDVQENFIKFISLSETTDLSKEDDPVIAVNPVANPKGVKLDFDLDITPDAYTELIFDIKSGDIIRGRGNGKINLQINTDEDFLMFGDFVIANGGYNFTLKNIINKEFDLIEGSKISWFGDPYGGVMDITAEYSQLTSLLPIITQNPSKAELESPDAQRKYPAIVVLNLEGPLLTPEIDFDIRIQDYPENISGYSVGPLVNAFSSKISSDEQELKRQVFSLIILRRFSPVNSFNVGGGQALGNSISEFISNQLSYWISQVDENLEIDVDLTTLDQDAFDTFQLRLAYTLLNGRLKISRDGSFTNNDDEADASAIVGDWTVEYLITPDGKLSAKMYNKTNYSAVNQALGDKNNTTAGFSIQYIRSFDQFRELLFKARKLPKVPKKKERKMEHLYPQKAQTMREANSLNNYNQQTYTNYY